MLKYQQKTYPPPENTAIPEPEASPDTEPVKPESDDTIEEIDIRFNMTY